jgi:hypothetical protein
MRMRAFRRLAPPLMRWGEGPADARAPARSRSCLISVLNNRQEAAHMRKPIGKRKDKISYRGTFRLSQRAFLARGELGTEMVNHPPPQCTAPCDTPPLSSSQRQRSRALQPSCDAPLSAAAGLDGPTQADTPPRAATGASSSPPTAAARQLAMAPPTPRKRIDSAAAWNSSPRNQPRPRPAALSCHDVTMTSPSRQVEREPDLRRL